MNKLFTEEHKFFYKYDLNVCLVPALSPNFGFGPRTFFCLVLVHALCKTFGFSPSIKYLLKKKTNGVPRGPIMARHVAN